MFVELVDQLRCPAPHAETWLVLAAEETRERHVLRGTLGCPVCKARWAVAEGIAHFEAPVGTRVSTRPGGDAPLPGAAASWPMRLAAFLDLAEGRGIVGLYGAFAAHAAALAHLVTVEPLAIDPAHPPGPGVSTVIPPSRAHVPVAGGALRAVAIDGVDAPAASAAAIVDEAVRLLRSGGRILAPARAPVPAGVREVARDADWWIGERDAAPSGVVSIAGRRRDG